MAVRREHRLGPPAESYFEIKQLTSDLRVPELSRAVGAAAPDTSPISTLQMDNSLVLPVQRRLEEGSWPAMGAFRPGCHRTAPLLARFLATQPVPRANATGVGSEPAEIAA